jgi:GDP-D-mannose 3',5'-epimerase
MRRACVTGAGGFIGYHLVEFLKKKGYYVVGVDVKHPEFSRSAADKFILRDLRNRESALSAYIANGPFDEVYGLAADVGGMGHISTHDADIVHSNLMINLNMHHIFKWTKPKVFFASSACTYSELKQLDVDVPPLREEDAWPAQPDTGYGLEKLMTEKLCEYYMRDYGVPTYAARFHNVFGTHCSWRGEWNDEKQEWDGGREKAPAALCRKIAVAKLKGENEIEVWGDGLATRSFLYIDDCVEGIYALMQSDHHDPINIGSDRLISVNGLVDLIADVAGVKITKKRVPGPQGVRGRNADLTRAKNILGWEPKVSLEEGMEKTYKWVEQQVVAQWPEGRSE